MYTCLDWATSLLDIYPKEIKHMSPNYSNVPRSFIHIRQLETTQISINKRMNKQTVVSSHSSRTLANSEKEQITDTWSNMDGSQKQCLE